MRVKFGAIVVDGRGKLGGFVLGSDRSGHTMKAKKSPINPRSRFQSTQRSYYSHLSQLWRTLTEEQRREWIEFAKLYTYLNDFGEAFFLTGFNIFIRLNTNLMSVSAAVLSVPVVPSAFPVVRMTSITFNVGGDSIGFFWSGTIPAGYGVKFFASRPMNAGVTVVGKNLRYFSLRQGQLTGGADESIDYRTKFGVIGPIGSRIWGSMSIVQTSSGFIQNLGIVSKVSTA